MRSVRATRSVSVFTLAALASLLATVAGCSAESGAAGSSGTAGTVRTADSIAASQVAKASDSSTDQPGHGGHMGGRHPGGPDFLLVAALREPINLSADQKTTIEGLLAANAPSGPHPFDKGRAATLAAGIRAGKVDTTAAPPPPDDAAMTARRTAAANALTTLHSTLTSTQRRALVDAIEQKGAQHAKDDAAHGVGPDGGPGWGHDPHSGGPHGDGGPIEHLLEGLDVTVAQQARIKAKLDAQRPAPPTDAERDAMKKEHEAMHAAMQAKLETFAGDSFDATAFVTPPAGAMKPGDHPDRFLTEIAIVTSVLDAAQREKLAARIEAGPPAPPANQPATP